jgi:SWI/SNF-related matrix-associated actin-dependent regulator of chromatin subfamily D
LPVEWIKASCKAGATYDCIQIAREWPETKNLHLKVKLWLDHSPRRFTLSEKLQKVLGMKEESRSRIVAALWQYIKSNRLQDSEKRQKINLNGELLDVFPGHEKLEFHQLICLLQQHMREADPLVLEMVVDRSSINQKQYLNLPVTVHSRAHSERL